jgi:hypothetical protein
VEIWYNQAMKATITHTRRRKPRIEFQYGRETFRSFDWERAYIYESRRVVSFAFEGNDTKGRHHDIPLHDPKLRWVECTDHDGLLIRLDRRR